MLAAWASGAAACSGDYEIGDLSKQDQQLEGIAADSGGEQQADTGLAAAVRAPDVTVGIETWFDSGMIATGDLNGDGFDDFAMAEIDFDTLTQYVHIRYGGARPADGEEFNTQAGDFILGERGARLVFDNFDVPIEGVASAGDVDGDGFGDLIVWAARCEPTQVSEGAYLLYGGPERLQDLTFLDDVAVQLVRPPVGSTQPEGSIGCGSNAQFVAGVGDLDGDGLDDFVLSDQPVVDFSISPPNRDGVTASAYLFYGREERLEDGTAWEDADATLRSEFDLELAPVGDIDADGLSDVFLGSNGFVGLEYPRGLVLLRGNSERLSGNVELDAAGARIDGASVDFAAPYRAATDLDGDGVNDVFLRDAEQNLHLFYGQAGLYDEGVDLASAAGVIPGTLDVLRLLVAAGDLDGDGDGDLVTHFSEEDPDNPFASDLAQLSGSAERRAGEFDFPIAEVRAARPQGMFSDGFRAIDTAVPAGDLDGDGADDLITTSTLYSVNGDGSFSTSTQQLHIHYGTPGGTSAGDPR